MKTKRGLFILLSVISIALIIVLASALLAKKPSLKTEQTFQLMEVHSPAKENATVYGMIIPKTTATVSLSINGQIEENNRSLAVGTTIKKDEILIKLDRLDALYQLLKQRSAFKHHLQKMLPEISTKFSGEASKWNAFEENIHREFPLPDLPAINAHEENEFLSQSGIISEYYTIKNTKQHIADHFYVTPFNGTIIESNVTPGSSIKKGEHLLTVAKNDGCQVVAPLTLDQVESYKAAQEVYFLSQKNDTIAKGKFLRTGMRFNDSVQVRAFFSIDKSNIKPQQIRLAIPSSVQVKKGISLPKLAIQGDSITIFAQNKLFRIPIHVVHLKKDSIEVNGLPSHCFVVLPKNKN